MNREDVEKQGALAGATSFIRSLKEEEIPFNEKEVKEWLAEHVHAL